MKAPTPTLAPPIDLLEPRTNLREFCAELPRVGGGAHFVSIQQPIDLRPESLRGVRGLYALAPFRCRTPAPEVQELFLSYDAAIDEQTARCFSKLVNVSIRSKQQVEVAWFSGDSLSGIACADDSIADWHTLASMTPSRLSATWREMPLEDLPTSVRWLDLLKVGPMSQKSLAPVWRLPAVEYLSLRNVQMTTLTKMASLETLSELHLRSTKSFKGIDRLRHLRSFHTTAVRCPPIGDITTCAALRELTIRAREPPEDLTALGRAEGLEKLTLWFGDIHRFADIGSFGFLRGLRNLRELRIIGVKPRNCDVTPINELSILRKLELSGAFGSEIRKLVRGAPGRKTTVKNMGGVAGRRLARFTPRRIAGTWTIFEDVSEHLGVKNNYDAEKLVREQLRAVEADVVARVDFDSEADSFCARTRSRADAERIAKVIRSMAKRS